MVVHRRVDEIVLNAADLDVVTASVKQTTSEAVQAKCRLTSPPSVPASICRCH